MAKRTRVIRDTPKPKPIEPPYRPADEVMALLKAGGTVTIAEVCAAAKELGMVIRLPPYEWVARTPGKTLYGWLVEYEQ